MSPDAKEKSPIRTLRERRGGVPREVRERDRRRRVIRKKLREILAGGPRTVPDLAAAAELPTAETLWFVMAMKKYGEVVEGDLRGGYYEYALKETPE
jgi:hypothetical protein